jgi:hypothetical protein
MPERDVAQIAVGKDHTMTTTTRRAALSALAGASALAIHPSAAGAMASADYPDAALLALLPAIKAADDAYKQTFEPRNQAEEAYMAIRPERPKTPGPTDGEWQDFLRRLPVAPRASVGEEADYERVVAVWEKECERLKIETGFGAAEKREDEACDVVSALRDRIVAIRATTLDGLKFKARYAVEHCDGEPDQEVMESIVADLLAFGSGEGENAT